MQKYPEVTIKKIKRLRKKGASISDLMKEFAMPKTTIWHHIHNIKIPEKYIAVIKSRQGGSKIRSNNDWTKANNQAIEILNSQSKYKSTLLAMLYWAEGSKNEFVFTNTDGKMIKLFLNILENDFNVKKERIKITIRTFSNLNKKECLKYWQDITKMPKVNFKVYINDGANKGRAPYGICRITIAKSGYLYKLVTSLIKHIAQ